MYCFDGIHISNNENIQNKTNDPGLKLYDFLNLKIKNALFCPTLSRFVPLMSRCSYIFLNGTFLETKRCPPWISIDKEMLEPPIL